MAKLNKTPKTTVICDEIVQIALMPELVEHLMTVVIKKEAFMQEVLELAAKGYSVQITFDSKRTQYSVRLAGITEGMENAGRMLYGNGSTIEHAFLALYGKHFLVSADGIWAQNVQTSGGLS
jgi:hypothetical protein